MSTLNHRQLKAVKKIGDVICPGTDQLPRFSSLDFKSRVDIVLNELPPADLADLKTLLTVFSFFPTFLLRFILLCLESLKDVGTPVGALIRMIRFGLRGIIFSLYYSSSEAHKAIGFEVKSIVD